ncbi:MAG: pyridoxamine 5'-phosphate oxidase family protein [Campylobacterales bacterium]|nr:pyridoxamine 5'-phosphate oxidase family protein [Campylobacterales bacterium]
MATKFEELNHEIIDFIEKQKIYFVATATEESFINLSPKGMDSFKIIDNKRVVWINATGSTNESSAHIQRNKRMTIMFCSFEKDPLIVKLIGNAKVIHKNDKEWDELSNLLPNLSGCRQIFDVRLEMVLTVCGMAVPYFEYKGERNDLREWAINQGDEGLIDYWGKKNQVSLNGEATHILEKNT